MNDTTIIVAIPVTEENLPPLSPFPSWGGNITRNPAEAGFLFLFWIPDRVRDDVRPG